MSNNDNEDDDIGYRKPPKRTRFKKGESGNPKGRPKSSRNTATLLLNILETVITVDEGGRRKRMTKREALMTRLVNDAILGNKDALRVLIKLLDVTQPAEPYEPDDNDEALLNAYVKRSKK